MPHPARTPAAREHWADAQDTPPADSQESHPALAGAEAIPPTPDSFEDSQMGLTQHLADALVVAPAPVTLSEYAWAATLVHGGRQTLEVPAAVPPEAATPARWTPHELAQAAASAAVAPQRVKQQQRARSTPRDAKRRRPVPLVAPAVVSAATVVTATPPAVAPVVAAAAVGASAGEETEEEKDARQRRKRRQGVEALRMSEEYIESHRILAASLAPDVGRFLPTPDPDDRSVSKRSWETYMQKWRQSMKAYMQRHRLAHQEG